MPLNAKSPSEWLEDAWIVANTVFSPSYIGGMKHVAQITNDYFSGEHRDDDELRLCLEKLKNRTAMKRLGYLIETMKIDAPNTLAFCLDNVSAGYSKFDPSAPASGTLMRRWNLQINVSIEAGE